MSLRVILMHPDPRYPSITVVHVDTGDSFWDMFQADHLEPGDVDATSYTGREDFDFGEEWLLYDYLSARV
jgi:hypothetical protein